MLFPCRYQYIVIRHALLCALCRGGVHCYNIYIEIILRLPLTKKVYWQKSVLKGAATYERHIERNTYTEKNISVQPINILIKLSSIKEQYSY